MSFPFFYLVTLISQRQNYIPEKTKITSVEKKVPSFLYFSVFSPAIFSLPENRCGISPT